MSRKTAWYRSEGIKDIMRYYEKTKKKSRQRIKADKILREVRKRNVSEFWLRFTVYFRPWLYELTERYKEYGRFPTSALWLLPSYYTDPQDKEIAALVALLINDDKKVYDRCREFRIAIGEHPWIWFRDRGFVRWSFPDREKHRTGGVLDWRVAELMNILWEGRRNKGAWLFEDTGVEEQRLRLLRLVLSTSDGIGLDLWATNPLDIKCPLTRDIKDCIATFFPDYRFCMTADEAIGLFGFERDADFFYAALAWKDFQGRNPKESSRLATVFQKRYNNCNILKRYFWLSEREGILPNLKEIY